MDLTCIHAAKGLCPRCQADYEEDAAAYLEYGDHPAGLRRYRELLEEIALDAAYAPTDRPAPDVPF